LDANALHTFWESYLATLPKDERDKKLPPAWAFGDSPEMADRLGVLVCDGVKTATASLLWEYEYDRQPVPQPGDLNIILDGARRPLCIIETVQVDIRPFDRVDEEFASREGEGDLSLDSWREAHWRFFSRACMAIHRVSTSKMPVVCETFQVVFRRH
jgi:uncharacterized protein YhfF